MALEIELDFKEYEQYLLQYPEDLRPPIKMALEQAMDEAVEYVKNIWSSVPYGNRMPGMTRTFFDPDYGKSIKAQRHNFKARIYTDYQKATEIEHGRPSIDLKPGLLNGPNAKVNAKGQRYNTVHFKHPTPGAKGSSTIKPLPEDVYRAALRGQKIPASSEMGMRGIRSGWSVGPYAGLRREGYTRGQYSTYRTVSEAHLGSQKWVIPQLPPIGVVSAVREFTEPHIHEIMSRSLPSFS